MRAIASPLIAVLALIQLLVFLPDRAAGQTTEADVYVAQGVLDLDDKRYEDALANFRRALEIEPEHVEALYYTGVVELIRKRPAAALPLLERARARSPRDPAIMYQLGLAYFSLDQYERAQPLLEEAFRANPQLDGAGYYAGFLRYRNKNYRGALEAFRSGRASDPEIQQLTRLYAGLSLAALGLASQGLAEVEQALKVAPGSAITGPAERLRDTIIGARAADRLFSAQVKLGFFVDDNVPVVPDRSRREPLVPLLRNRTRFSSGELLGVGVAYSWLKHVLPRDDWDSAVGYTFFGTYNNDLPDFNVMDHVFTVNVVNRAVAGPIPIESALTYSWDLLTLDEDVFLKRHSVLLSTTLFESDRHVTQLFVRYQNKDFSDDPAIRAENRDATNWMFGFTHILRFQEAAHFVKLGYQFDYEDARGRNYEYTGHRLLAGGQYTLPWYGIRLKYDADVHLRDYVNQNTILPTFAPHSRRRADQEITQVARVEVPLPWLKISGNPFFTERSFTLAIEYQRVDAHSNLAVFDYTRNVGSVILGWSY